MPVINRIADFQAEMADWRHDLHTHPETAFAEHRTAELVARLLESFGIAVERGVARTGVIGTLSGSKDAGRAIALRADMDALPIEEKNGFPHASQHQGRMHACGHDGHTAMLLGAAKYLAETRNFAGTVHFIFQPAEENEGGARLMIEEGVLDRYKFDAVYGMHNWPGLPAGQFAIRPGAMMAAFDIFEITIAGRGAHAAMPHLGIDPVVAAAQIVTGLQTIASRNIHPLEGAVVSVTQIHGGDTWNVIPDSVVLRGTTRAFSPAVRDALEPAIRRIAEGACAALGAQLTMRYERRYPPTVNSAAETDLAAATAAALVGADNVRRDLLPSMAAEDFAWFLEKRPGAYIWIDNGVGADQAMLQPALRFQRRDPGARRQLLGAPRRNRAGKTGRLRQHIGAMAITALDTHQTVKDLTAAGFTDAQAEALTSALRQVQQIDLSDLATKADLADLRNEMKLEFANVKREMAEMKTELIKWVLGIGFAQVAAIVALLRLFPGVHT